MSFRMVEGFELRKNTTALSQAYNTVTGTPTFTTGRLHGTAMACASDSTMSIRKVLDSQSTWIVGLAFKRQNTGNTDGLILLRSASGVEIGVLTTLLGGNLELMVALAGNPAGTTWTTNLDLQYDTWYFVEFKVTLNTTTGSFELRVNGVSGLVQTGINTSGQGQNSANDIELMAANTGGTAGICTIDDAYVLDGNSSPNDFLGDGVSEAILPTGAGNATQWTPLSGANWENVDDGSGPDNDASYVSTAGTGIKDTYAFGNLSFITGNIVAVQVSFNARLLSAGTRTVRPIVRHSGTDYAGTNQNITSTSYAEKSQVYATNPGTGSAWTLSDVNGAEFGLEAVA